MVKTKTLNKLSQLGDSEFNKPPPRHGLCLLYWFACEYKQLKPKSKDYGFHPFHNRIEDDDDQLLPKQNQGYYEVGNLNDTGAEKLPKYVRPYNKIYSNEGNKDRIIVLLNDSGYIDRVYVTEHQDKNTFNSSHTYRVSQGLLEQIKGMKSEQFLKQMEQQRKLVFTNQSKHTYTEENSTWSWCTIL